MPSWLIDLLKPFGFAIPFGCAAAIYWFFHWLDKRSSPAARKAIREWFTQVSYKRDSVRETLDEIFKKLYSAELFSLRGFIRSALISVFVTFAVSMIVMIVQQTTFKVPRLLTAGPLSPGWLAVLLTFAANIGSDYVSLFFVRYCLLAAGTRPIRTMLAAASAGAAVILTLYFLKSVLWVLLAPQSLLVYPPANFDVLTVLASAISEISGELRRLRTHGMLWGALAVHSWLILLAFGVLFMQLANYLVSAVRWMQWFLRYGDRHPLDAIGCVAGALVCLAVAAAQTVPLLLNALR
jgi:hypothetical protein